MDERKNNIRLVRDNESRAGEREYSAPAKSGREAFEHKVSYQKRQKERRMKKKRRRAAFLLVLVIIIVVILLFLTPIFNIRSLSVEGNNIITDAQITEILKPLVGQNLLRTGSGSITKMLKTNPYVDTVDVQKKLFPPSVEVKITEYTPAAFIRTEGKTLEVNSKMHVLTDSADILQMLPVITGVEVTDYAPGEDITLSNDEKTAALSAALTAIESTGMLDKIIEIDITNLTYIIMNYDDRIQVKCGTSLDLDRKIRLLAEAVTSNSLSENSKGTIDLSETGKAVYTP